MFAIFSGAAEDGAASKGGASVDGVSAGHADKKLENGDSAPAGPGNADTDSQGPPSSSATGRPPGKCGSLTFNGGICSKEGTVSESCKLCVTAL